MGQVQSQNNNNSKKPRQILIANSSSRSLLCEENGKKIKKKSNDPCDFVLNRLLFCIPKKEAISDPIGTPLPETPVFQRKQRQQIIKDALVGKTSPASGRTIENALAAGIPDVPLPPPIVNAANNSSNNKNLIPPFTASKYYSGLEKEISSSSVLSGGKPAASANGVGNENEGPSAPIHEGPDAERTMHAKYQLMEVLGVGSTSTVHRCVNRRTGLHCACKLIDKQHMEERFIGMLDQFQTEIDALRRLHHPNIIQLYDVYITDEKIYIIMELMEGGELFDYVVQKGTLNEEEASRIVRKVTSALVYMHSKDICHRDLKPENLLLRTKPRTAHDIEVKIIDFGLSKAMEEPVARSFLGTRGYIAPEMLQRRDYTRAVDTWALGVIVFVLLCGCLPFDDDSQTVPSDDLVRARFVLRFPRWANNLSKSAKDLLSHLLDVNPRQRYSAEQALYHPWVQGTTAPRNNLLASPGRIKKSPKLQKSPRITPTNNKKKKNGRKIPNGQKNNNNNNFNSALQSCSPTSGMTPPTPNQRIIVRKNSF